MNEKRIRAVVMGRSHIKLTPSVRFMAGCGYIDDSNDNTFDTLFIAMVAKLAQESDGDIKKSTSAKSLEIFRERVLAGLKGPERLLRFSPLIIPRVQENFDLDAMNTADIIDAWGAEVKTSKFYKKLTVSKSR
mgnify:CR=1 FL=1